MAQQLVFFDIDGTLCVPTYKDKEGKFVVGFSDEGWFEFCRENGDDGYKYCKPVKPVVRYAEKRKSEGAKLFVLSTAQSKEEIASKIKYINETFPGLFERVLTVSADIQKLEIMGRIAHEYGGNYTDVEIVEDTYATILKANEIGIKATHISSIVCDL